MTIDGTFGNPLSLRVDRRDLSVMSLSPCGRDAVLAGHRGLLIVDLDDPFAAPRWLQHDTKWSVADVQWCPHKERPYWIVSTSNQKALVWNLNSCSDNAIEFTLHGHNRAITDINFSPHHPDILATCSVDSTILQWDLRNPSRPIGKWTDWRASASQVKWHSEDPNLVASAHDNVVLVWDIRKGAKPLKRIEAHLGKINGLSWTPDGELVSCSNDMTVKFWDLNKETPVYNIETEFPVARARYVPFGKNICGIMPLRGGDDSIWLTNYTNGGLLKEDCVFKGHSGPIRDFLWRNRVIDDKREYQLVTWSSDCDLRLWPIDNEIREKCETEANVDRKMTESPIEEYEYKTYRNEPMNSLNNITSNKRIMRRHKLRTNGDINHLNWISGVKLGKEEVIGNYQPLNLGEEVSTVGHKFSKLRFERISVSTGNIIISFNGPWSSTVNEENNNLIFIRLEINFPNGYPSKNSIPKFKIEETHELKNETRNEMIKGLLEISQKLCELGKCCLEPCMRYLLGEQIDLDMELGMENEIEYFEQIEDTVSLGAENSEDEEDEEEEEEEEEDLVELDRPLFDSTPIPKGCGAIWSPSGHLICFFLPKQSAIQAIKFGQSGFSLITEVEKKNNKDNFKPVDEFDEYEFDEFDDGLQLYDRIYRSRITPLVNNSNNNSDVNELMKANNLSTAPTKNIVKIINFQDLIPAKMELAYEYRIIGSSSYDLAYHNGQIAKKYGCEIVSECWEILSLTLRKKCMNHPFNNNGVIIRKMFEYFREVGDIQMLAMISCILSINRMENKGFQINNEEFIDKPKVHRLGSISTIQTYKSDQGSNKRGIKSATGHGMNGNNNSMSRRFSVLTNSKSMHNMNSEPTLPHIEIEQFRCKEKECDKVLLQKENEYREQYASILFEWGLPLNRVKVLKFNTKVNPCVSTARKLKSKEHNVVIENEGDGKCSICEITTTKNRVILCLKCTHGFHPRCGIQWFEADGEIECPSGCGCYCLS